MILHGLFKFHVTALGGKLQSPRKISNYRFTLKNNKGSRDKSLDNLMKKATVAEKKIHSETGFWLPSYFIRMDNLRWNRRGNRCAAIYIEEEKKIEEEGGAALRAPRQMENEEMAKRERVRRGGRGAASGGRARWKKVGVPMHSRVSIGLI